MFVIHLLPRYTRSYWENWRGNKLDYSSKQLRVFSESSPDITSLTKLVADTVLKTDINITYQGFTLECLSKYYVYFISFQLLNYSCFLQI